MYANNFSGIGNIVSDPELKYTPNDGRAWTKFPIALNEYYYEDEELKQRTTFVDVTAWDSWAERICRHLGRGRSIYVQGKLVITYYTDKRHNNLRRKNVQIDGFYFSWHPEKQEPKKQESNNKKVKEEKL